MWQSTAVLVYAIISQYILNAVFLFIYLTAMHKDEFYLKWRESRKTKEVILVIFALLTSF